MRLTFRHTRYACYMASFSQAVIVNLAPIFFVIFRDDFKLSFEQLGRLILVNFLTQLFADFVSIRYADRLGYRLTICAAMGLNALGLAMLALLPGWLPDAYAALMIATVVYSFGGGICEVVTSPLLDALPGEEKEAAMSMMHSFYCWGQMTVIALTTLALYFLGLSTWRIIALCWALMPLAALLLLAFVPLGAIVPAEEQVPLGRLLRSRGIPLAMLLMIAAGASELSMSQWASYFVQCGLKVPKMLGDLLGPCMFALLMGSGRLVFGIWGARIPLRSALLGCALLGIVSYVLTTISPWAWLSLVGCALTGLSVSLLWPGTLSLMAAKYPTGGTTMFGLLAVCGDIGCSTGPWVCGLVADACDSLNYGLLVCTIFPLSMALGILNQRRITPVKP